MHNTFIKTAAPTWDQIKDTISGGARKAVGMLPVGHQKFLEEHGGDIGRGLAGAAIAGGIYGVTANRRGYESEEEFRRRRFRGTLQSALLAGGAAAAYSPVKNWLSKGIPEMRQNINRKVQLSQINADPELQHGNLRLQKGLAAGFSPEELAPGDPTAPQPKWMDHAELARDGTRVAGVGVGAALGAKAGYRYGRFKWEPLTEANKGTIGKHQEVLDIERGHQMNKVNQTGRHAYLSRKGVAARHAIKSLKDGAWSRGVKRHAVGTAGGVAGGVAGGILGDRLGAAFQRALYKDYYDPNFVDRSASGLASPGSAAPTWSAYPGVY